jgi:hypothetical protein
VPENPASDVLGVGKANPETQVTRSETLPAGWRRESGSRLPQSKASPLLERRVWLGIDDAGGPTTQGSVTVNTSHEIAVIPAKHRHADTPGNEILNLHGFVEARGAPNTPIQ